jgi:hypothetical protein
MKLQGSSGIRRVAALVVLGAGLATPATAGTLYHWRTEEGTYAYTDNPKQIPARYRDQVEVRALGRLADYRRLTPQDSAASKSYAQRLSARLAELRQANAAPAPTGESPLASGPQTLALRTGSGSAPLLELPVAGQAGSEPLVVDTLFTRPAGKLVTRQSVVVRRGDQTLAVVRPRLREWNVADDIHAEEGLVR